MKKNRAISAAIILVLLWLLFGLNMSVYAENIPISSSSVEKIGVNKIRLESGIGVLVFDMSEEKQGDILRGNGYLTMSNTYNNSFGFTCRVVTVLSTVDLDVDGNNRIHPKINPVIVFKPLPDSSYVTLEDTHAVIEPFSVYHFRYEIRIPICRVLNDREGYLFYINIGRDLSNSSGMNIAINYNYKVFIIFTNVEKNMGTPMWLFFLVPSCIILCTVVIYRKKNHKIPVKADVTLEPKPRVIDPVVVVEPISDSDSDIHDCIDELLKKNMEADKV